MCDVSLALLIDKADREYLAGLVRVQLTHEDFTDPRVELHHWLYGEPERPDAELRDALGV